MQRKLALILMVMGAVVVTSCSSHRTVVHSTSSSPKIGPPPHAPAHGYRHKHRHGVELLYDSQLEVYVVVKHPRHYYRDECYYRETGGRWEISVVSIEGPWKPVAGDRLPPGLQKKIKKTKETKESKEKKGHKKKPGHSW